MMGELRKLPTGVPGLDDLLQGGLPAERATLISGRSGTYKTLTGLQVLCNLARAQTPGLLVAIEERSEDLIHAGDSLGFGVSPLLERGTLKILDFNPPMADRLDVAGAFDLQGLVKQLRAHAEGLGARCVLLDSLSALFGTVDGSGRLRALCHALVDELTGAGLTLLMTASSKGDYGEVAMWGIEDFVCDVVLKFRNVVDGKRRRRSVEVHKYRRSAHLKGEYPCAMTQTGLSVFPLDVSNPEQQGGRRDLERYPTGVEGLDVITGGGWFRDSIVLVRGPTGSGKTILAGVFALAGAARGERVFYYGFEETRTMLVRNFGSLGMDVERYVQEGTLKIVSRFPESTSPEDMVIELRTVLSQYSPSLIVLDSISAIEHIVSYESFRQLMIGMTSALRRHGRSALLTQAISADRGIDDAAPYLSTMSDAIVQLGFEAQGPDLLRSVRVYKMRGAAHDLREHHLHLGQGGVTVGQPLVLPDERPAGR